jgi:hypothetical protein
MSQWSFNSSSGFGLGMTMMSLLELLFTDQVPVVVLVPD